MSSFINAAFENGVLSVTLNRPGKLNALNIAMIAELGSVFAAWSAREEVVVATLTGAGTKCFSSGGDIQELSAIRTEADAMAFSTESRKALDTIRRFPVLVVALLNGDALGGGAELALACDLRIAAHHAKDWISAGAAQCFHRLGRGSRLIPVTRLEPGAGTAERDRHARCTAGACMRPCECGCSQEHQISEILSEIRGATRGAEATSHARVQGARYHAAGWHSSYRKSGTGERDLRSHMGT